MKLFLSLIFILSAASWLPAQHDSLLIQQKWDRYHTVWQKHNLQLVFNQEKYAAGDTAFFKAYLWKEDFTLVTERQLVTINLIDSQGQVVNYFIFTIENGISANQIFIPDSIASGIYLVTAHTNWMRNFGPDFLFQKPLIITTEKSVIVDEPPMLRVRPEGGHLIQGIESRIGVTSNRPKAAIQLLEDQVAIDTLVTDSLGNAAFQLIPKAGHSYRVRIQDQLLEAALPAVAYDGIAMHVSEQRVRITVPSTSALRAKKLVMLITAQGKIYQVQPLRLESEASSVSSIYTNNLPPGHALISIVDAEGTTWANRSFFYHGEQPVNLSVSGKLNYRTREKVSLTIHLTDKDQAPLTGEFAVSVINTVAGLGTMTAFQNNNVWHNESLTSFLKNSLDNMLMTENETLPWNKILAGTFDRPGYSIISVMEKKGVVYRGDTKEPVQDYTQILIYLQRSQLWYQTFTVDNGKISLTLPDFYGTDEFFYLATNKDGVIDNVFVKWEDESVELPKAPSFKEKSELDDYASFSEKRKMINLSFSVMETANDLATAQSLVPQETPTSILMTEPDSKVNVQDYVIFSTMQDLLKEIVTSVYYRKKKNSELVRVKLIQPLWEVGDPLYIIDGIATKNTSFFLSLKPSDVLTIEVITRPLKLIPLGLLGKNGIIIVRTKRGDTREPLQDKHKIIQGIQPVVKFPASNFSTDSSLRIPDFRSTIYWNPTIKTNNNGRAKLEFYCSDDIGQLMLDIKGVTLSGKLFSKRIHLRVDGE